jgi:outer membrane receptor for ferrienterochelin and colicin
MVRTILIVMGLLAAWPSFSQDTRDLLQMSLEELMNVPISTASKHEQRIGETPATVYVFTDQDIRENGYRYLSDLLRYIPNMEVHWSGGPQYVVETKLRGLEEFIVLMDGVRINPASSVAPHFGYVYPLNQVKRVEVIMGPSSALYGADACAGIINIITYDPHTDTTAYHVSLFGGNQSQRGAQVLMQQPFKALALQLSASGFHSNDNDRSWWPYLEKAFSGYPANAGEHYAPEYENPLTSFTAAGKVISGSSTLGFNFWTRDVDGGLRLDPAKYTVNQYTKTSSYQYLAYLQNQTALSDRLTLLSRLSHDYYRVRYNFYYVETKLDDPKHYRESADRFYWLEELDYQLTERTRLLFGLIAQSTVSVPKAYESITDSTGKEIGFGDPISDNDALTYYQIRSGGVYLQAENAWLQDRLKTNVGIRADYFSTFGLVANPRASVYFKPAEPLGIRLMYGTAFLTPPPDRMYRTTYVPGQRYQTTNESLEPRKNANYEAAVDYRPFKWLALGGRAFRNEVKDEIVFVNTQASYTVGADTVDIYQYQNIGRARYEGLEGQVRLFMPFKINAQSSLSYLRGYTREDRDAEKKGLDLLSKVKASWSLNRAFLKTVHLSVQGLHLLKRRVPEGNALYPRGEMPDVFLLNFFIHADRVWKGLGGEFKIENLLNQEWSDIPSTSSSASPELPQSRIRFSLGIRWQY